MNDSVSKRGLLYQKLTDGFDGDEEERLQWIARCESALEQSSPQSVKETEKRLGAKEERSPLRKKLGKLRPLFTILLAAVVLSIAGLSLYRKYRPLLSIDSVLQPSSAGTEQLLFPLERTKKFLSKEELLFVFGDQEEKIADSRRATLYRDNPENLSYLSDYLLEKSNPPISVIDKAIKADPNNGWFKLYYAGCLAKKSLVRNPEHHWDESQPKWICENPELLKQALQLTQEAGMDSEFIRYPTANHARRISLLPPPKTFFDQLETYVVVASDSIGDGMKILDLANGIRVGGSPTNRAE